MALSNWDTLAFDSKGKPCNGVLESFVGSKCEIYKNWLYIHHEAGWSEGGQYCKPVVAEISSGDIQIAGIQIKAKRGPQNGVFVYAEAVKYGKDNKSEYRRMTGIACYGYDNPIPRMLASVGVNPADVNPAFTCTGVHCEPGKKSVPILSVFYKNGDRKEYPVDESLDSQFVGVLPETYKEFLAFLDEIAKDREYDKEFLAWLKVVKEAEPLRANQGDMYFADRVDGIGDVATPVGEANGTILGKICEQMKEVTHE